MEASMRNWLVVVPARLASQRLAEKPLQDLGGKPLIVRVHENLEPLRRLGAQTVVATDAHVVMAACQKVNVPCVMTSEAHESGTDRCNEAAQGTSQPYVMNVQGDEPFVSTEDLVRLARGLENKAEAGMATLVFAQKDPAMARDPNVVKAVRSAEGYALYFSRAPIPYVREARDQGHLPLPFWQHLGIYAFRRDALQAFCDLKPTFLERTEKLEQLRALENGWKILLEPAAHMSRGIDTPEDLEAARARF
jgi:3-deoxy-manno-octulosonate cytidylyltransferase (CMP-KDO synthetase)